MVDRQSKELYQQQLAAHAAWRAAAGYSAAASQHSGFAAPGHGSSANAYENYVLQNMLGGASNILGNGAKDMAGYPFRFPGQFANLNYQRPLPAHSALTAHMKNASSSSTPLTAHMMSNPYQYSANHGLNPSYGAGAMNPNYLQSNMGNQGQETANYMNQSAERFRQQFDQSQFEKEQSAIRQENSRRQAGMLNGGMTQDATNAFNLHQLQAAYSQAALSSNAAMLKDASKAKTPANNYSYYPSPQAPSTQAASYAGMNSSTDLNDQIAKELLSRFGDRLTPQFLQRLQTASLTQSFQQSQLNLQRMETGDGEKQRLESSKGESTAKSVISETPVQDLRPAERNSTAEYLARLGASMDQRLENKDVYQEKGGGGAAASSAHSSQELHRNQSQGLEFTSPYQMMNFNAKNEANQRLSEYAAQYQRAQEYGDPRSIGHNLMHAQNSSHNRASAYGVTEEIKSPAVNSPAAGNQQVSPASVHSPVIQQQISPAPSQVSSAQQPFSPNHIPSNDPKMSPYSQSQQMSPYSQASPKMSPYSQASPNMSPYSQPSPKMSPYSQPSPKMTSYSQPSPKMSPYSQPSPKMSPYSQQSPKMSPYSQVSPAYHQPVLGATPSSPSYPPETIITASSCSMQQKPESAYPVPSYLQKKEAKNDLSNDVQSTKPSDIYMTANKGNLRNTTDSPRLETPPGLTLPASGEETIGRDALPLVAPPVSPRIEAPILSKSINSNKAATATPSVTSSSSSFFTANPISGMASMTNKIKMLESKMQIAKTKTSVEDNSLKNWWKPQVEQQSKPRSSIAPSTSITSDESSGSKKTSDEAEMQPAETRQEVGTPTATSFAHSRTVDYNINGKLKYGNSSQSSPANYLTSPVPSSKSDHFKFHESPEATSPQSIRYEDPPLQASEQNHLTPKRPDPAKVHPASNSAPISQAPIHPKKSVAPSTASVKPNCEATQVPFDFRQRSQDSYATPNLERMEIKNSGIPGPSAVTWKRKSTEDSFSSSLYQSKKRKLDKSATGNDIYQFDEEKDPELGINSKEDKVTKGPVYKYKNALISRDYDTEPLNSKSEQVEDSQDSEQNESRDQLALKKKNKRPKHEEWSVIKNKSSKASKLDYTEEMETKSEITSRKGPLWGLPVVPKTQHKSTEKVNEAPSLALLPEPVKKEVKVSADKWYQAFGAGDVRNKKKVDKPNLKKDFVKEEYEEKTVKSILEIPPEVRRKPRPNFGGIIHFSPDWNRLVKRHHDRCRVPFLLDSSSSLKPKVLVGHTTPKKSYEDYARKDMVSPPDLLSMERERMGAKALTEILSPKAPDEELGGELPSIVETILENRKKLRLGAKMGRMYQIPFQKEKKRMRMRMSKGPSEQCLTEDNMGLIPTPGLPLLTPDTREVLLANPSNPCYGSFRAYTLNKYLDYGELGKPKTSLWNSEVLDSKTRSKSNCNPSSPSLKEIFGVDTPLKRVKGRKEKTEPESEESLQEVKVKKKTKKDLVEPIKLEIVEKPVFKEKFVPIEKEVDDTFAFSQEIGEPTEEENILQTELGGFALDLLDDNPSWVNQVTIQNLVVWEPIQPISVKKKKPKKKRGKKSGWDFPVGKRKSKTSRDVSRAGSPVLEEIHDIEYTLENVIQESNRWVIDKNAGETILQRASKMGYPDVVAYSVGMQDMSVREKDYAGFMPLDKAAFRGNHEVVKILLKYGGDASSGVKGTRALHDAVEASSPETVQVLLSYGADPLLHNYSGNMPIDLAKEERNMKKYLVNILADLHGKPPNVRGIVPPVERWNVSHSPEFHDPCLDPRYSDPAASEDDRTDLDDFVFEVSSQPLPNEFQFLDREGDFVIYRELKEFAKRFGHHKGDIKTKCYIIEMKKSEFLKTSHCKLLHRRDLEVKYHSRTEEDTIILVKVDKFVRKILNAERISIPR